MAKQTINIGTVAGDGTGDPLRTALDKVNDNFDELYTAESAAAAHIADTDNPHEVSKADVGLGNCDNTSDLNKPVSTAAQAALDLKAPLASPALSGTPTAPTAAAATNTTQIATTAFVRGEINSLLDGAPAALDTLNELAAAINDDASFASTITSALAGKAASSHTHAQSDITGLETALAALLPKSGGTMTGALSITAGGLNTSPLAVSQTWNNAGVTCRGLELAVTDTNSAAGSTLLRLLGGAGGATERFRVDKSGNTTVAGTLTVGGGTFQDYGGGQIGLGSHYFSANGIFAHTSLRVSTGALGGGFSASLYPNGAGSDILELRNGAAAQKFRVFGTETGGKYAQLEHDGTNAKLTSSSGDLHISSLPTSNPGPGILWNNAGTPAIGT